MGIGEDIKQGAFKNQFSKAIINIYYTNNWLHQKHHELFRGNGITTPQFNVLRILRGQHPNPATVNLIIERMLDKSSNASRIIDKLESKELVLRKQCSSDRRAVDVIISKKGLALLAEMDKELDSLEGSIQKLSDEESGKLSDLLDKLRS